VLKQTLLLMTALLAVACGQVDRESSVSRLERVLSERGREEVRTLLGPEDSRERCTSYSLSMRDAGGRLVSGTLRLDSGVSRAGVSGVLQSELLGKRLQGLGRMNDPTGERWLALFPEQSEWDAEAWRLGDRYVRGRLALGARFVLDDSGLDESQAIELLGPPDTHYEYLFYTRQNGTQLVVSISEDGRFETCFSARD
jgi:hypothetical protein